MLFMISLHPETAFIVLERYRYRNKIANAYFHCVVKSSESISQFTTYDADGQERRAAG